jgi:hypothetical protein
MQKNTLHHHQALENLAMRYDPPVVVVVVMTMVMVMICQHQRKGQLFLYKGKRSESHYEEKGKIFSLWKIIAFVSLQQSDKFCL